MIASDNGFLYRRRPTVFFATRIHGCCSCLACTRGILTRTPRQARGRERAVPSPAVSALRRFASRGSARRRAGGVSPIAASRTPRRRLEVSRSRRTVPVAPLLCADSFEGQRVAHLRTLPPGSIAMAPSGPACPIATCKKPMEFTQATYRRRARARERLRALDV